MNPFGSKRVKDCRCDYRTTCGPCLAASVVRKLALIAVGFASIATAGCVTVQAPTAEQYRIHSECVRANRAYLWIPVAGQAVYSEHMAACLAAGGPR